MGSGGDHHSRQLWLVPSEGQPGRHLVAEVAVDAPAADLYTYAVPDELRDIVRPGAAVQVPFGRGARPVAGLCLRISEREWDHTLRPLFAAEHGPDWLSNPLIELGLWVSEYYACWPWRTFTAILPSALRKPRLRRVTYVRRTGALPDWKLTRRQTALLEAVGPGETRPEQVLRKAGAGPPTLRALVQRGLLERVVRREPAVRDPLPPTEFAGPCAEDSFELTAGQSSARDQIIAAARQDDPFRVFVLFGVPGSGKTEVYVRAARDAVQRGRQVIMLIPEIALATQIVERLARRFERVAVLHSQLPPRFRRDTLEAIAAGEVDVIIGTRTAVFAPCPRLGLIVVDEEQEGSFKNLAAPYYHARDVAIKRGQLERVPVVLGSATPALETWRNAHERAHYQLLNLPERVPGARLPEVKLVEWAARDLGPAAPLLSPDLQRQIDDTLAAGQQVILLHNRRGYAVYLRCQQCGLTVSCERCGCHLVYHRYERALKCHRCGARTAVPPSCLDDTCGGRLVQTGLAIQRLEEDLRRRFPRACLQRLDSDTMRRREDYRAALRAFESGAADILLGTQMVAKGLDFPRVRLVGVIDADAALSLPDFRASERVFQLVVQVVGRAGRRDGPSLALVQTAQRPPPVIRHALRLDYPRFADEELQLRERLDYPPATRLLRLVCADARPNHACRAAELLAERLTTLAGRIDAGLRVDPAEPCTVSRTRGWLRYQVLLRGRRGNTVQQLLHAAVRDRLFPPRVQRFTVDVDPIDLL